MPANRDTAASLGMPAAVEPHPGWDKHLINVKLPRSSAVKGNTGRSANRGFRIGRRAQARG